MSELRGYYLERAALGSRTCWRKGRIATGYFIPPRAEALSRVGIHKFHFLGIVFALLVGFILVIGWAKPREEPWQMVDYPGSGHHAMEGCQVGQPGSAASGGGNLHCVRQLIVHKLDVKAVELVKMASAARYQWHAQANFSASESNRIMRVADGFFHS